jgi:tetratricopeptide (TPR) repeat protein
MRKQDQLLSLVNSLTPSEKRYFKLYNNIQPGSKKYDRLFNELAKREHYDATLICKNLKVTKSQLANDKKYLEKVLIKALRSFNDKTSLSIELNNALIDIEVLQRKGQREMCMAIINNAKKICNEDIFATHMLLLLYWEKELNNNLPNVDDRHSARERIRLLEKKFIEKTDNSSECGLLRSKVHLIMSRLGSFVDEQSEQELRELLKNPLLTNVTGAKSFGAKLDLYATKAAAYATLHQWNEGYHCLKEWCAVIESKPGFTVKQPGYYSQVLTGLVTMCILNEKFGEAVSNIKKIELIPQLKGVKLSEADAMLIRRHIMEQKMVVQTFSNNYPQGISYFNKTLGEVGSDKKIWTPRLFTYFYFCGAFCYFHKGQFEESLKNLRIIINESDIQKPDEGMIYTYMLHLMTQYELRAFEVIPYQLKALSGFAKRVKFKSRTLDAFLKLFTALSKSGNAESHHSHFKQYENIFTQLAKAPRDRDLQVSIGIQNWLSGKIQSSKPGIV